MRAIARFDRTIEVEVVRDGAGAVQHLCAEGTVAPLPDLVLLDWKLTRVMGAEVLRAIRESRRCKGLPVVAFSSSDNPEERLECLALKGNAFVTKPVEYYKFLAAVGQILLEHAPQIEKQMDGERLSHRVQASAGEQSSGPALLEPDAAGLKFAYVAA